MIKNDRQREVTLEWVARFERNLELAEGNSDSTVHPKLRQARIDAYRSQLVTFRQELAEYDTLKASGPLHYSPVDISELPRLLIKARIAAGISEAELGRCIGLSEAEVFRMEDFEYAEAEFYQLEEAATAIGVKLTIEPAHAPTGG